MALERRLGRYRPDPLEKIQIEVDYNAPDFDLDRIKKEHYKKYPHTRALFIYPKVDPNEPE